MVRTSTQCTQSPSRSYSWVRGMEDLVVRKRMSSDKEKKKFISKRLNDEKDVTEKDVGERSEVDRGFGK